MIQLNDNELEKIMIKLDNVIRFKPDFQAIKDILYFNFLAINTEIYTQIEEKFKMIIEIYDDSLNDKEKLDVLSSLSSKTIFEWYFQKHFNLFQNIFESTVFIYNRDVSDTDCLYEFKMELEYQYPKQNYKIMVCDFNNILLETMYHYFYDEIKFFDQNHQIEKYNKRIIYDASFFSLLQIFCIELKKDNNLKNILNLLENLEKNIMEQRSF